MLRPMLLIDHPNNPPNERPGFRPVETQKVDTAREETIKVEEPQMPEKFAEILYYSILPMNKTGQIQDVIMVKPRLNSEQISIRTWSHEQHLQLLQLGHSLDQQLYPSVRLPALGYKDLRKTTLGNDVILHDYIGTKRSFPYNNPPGNSVLKCVKQVLTEKERFHNIIAKKGGHTISLQNYASFLPGLWLSDEAISFVVDLVNSDSWFNKIKMSGKGLGLPDAHIFNSFFMTNVMPPERDSMGYDYFQVRNHFGKALGGKCPLEYDVLPFLWNVTKTHWCVVAVFPKLRMIEIFDSANPDNLKQTTKTHLDRLYRWIYDEVFYNHQDDLDNFLDENGNSPWTVHFGRSIAQQDNTVDCGIYALCFAIALAKRLDITPNQFKKEYANNIRLHCMAHIYNNHLTLDKREKDRIANLPRTTLSELEFGNIECYKQYIPLSRNNVALFDPTKVKKTNSSNVNNKPKEIISLDTDESLGTDTESKAEIMNTDTDTEVSNNSLTQTNIQEASSSEQVDESMSPLKTLDQEAHKSGKNDEAITPLEDEDQEPACDNDKIPPPIPNSDSEEDDDDNDNDDDDDDSSYSSVDSYQGGHAGKGKYGYRTRKVHNMRRQNAIVDDSDEEDRPVGESNSKNKTRLHDTDNVVVPKGKRSKQMIRRAAGQKVKKKMKREQEIYKQNEARYIRMAQDRINAKNKQKKILAAQKRDAEKQRKLKEEDDPKIQKQKAVLAWEAYKSTYEKKISQKESLKTTQAKRQYIQEKKQKITEQFPESKTDIIKNQCAYLRELDPDERKAEKERLKSENAQFEEWCSIMYVRGYSRQNAISTDGSNLRQEFCPQRQRYKYNFYVVNFRRKDEKTKASQLSQINPEYVRRLLNPIFLYVVHKARGQFVHIPIGDASDEEAQPSMRTNVPCKFQQGELNHCLAYSLSSCLDYVGLVEGGEKLASFAEQLCYLPFNVQIQQLRQKMIEVVPEIGQCAIYNQRAGRPRKKVIMTLDQLIRQKSIFPTLVIPRGRDNSCSHAFCVVDDLIFDSTQKFALKLKRDVIDWICGDQGAEDTPIAIYIFNRNHGKNRKYEKSELEFHWDE